MKKVADRQGDVTIVHEPLMDPATVLAQYGQHKVGPLKGRIVLAEGEVTGHAHALKEKGVVHLRPPHLPAGQSLLVVNETEFAKGDLIDGTVLETMDNGTMRFKKTDGVVIRFPMNYVQLKGKAGVKVLKGFSLLKHDEHDALPVAHGVFTVVRPQQMDAQQQRRIYGD